MHRNDFQRRDVIVHEHDIFTRLGRAWMEVVVVEQQEYGFGRPRYVCACTYERIRGNADRCDDEPKPLSGINACSVQLLIPHVTRAFRLKEFLVVAWALEDGHAIGVRESADITAEDVTDSRQCLVQGERQAGQAFGCRQPGLIIFRI